MSRLGRSAAVALALIVGTVPLGGCSGGSDQVDAATESPSPTGPRRGAPELSAPQSVAAAVETSAPSARVWQDDPRPVGVTALVRDGGVEAVEVTWLAAGADRFFELRMAGGGQSERRPTLATIGVTPIDEPGIDAIPAPPEELLDPAELVEASADALRGCGVDPAANPIEVDYASGAPFAWTGEAWAEELAWSATVGIVGDGGAERGARVDPVSGDAAGEEPCYDVPAA